MKSVFRESEWRENRHFLNPSKWKEYELHVSGLGFLNRVNFIKEYFEKFTIIDNISSELLQQLNKNTALHLIRKKIFAEEREALEKNGFRLERIWGTLIKDLQKDVTLDNNTLKNVRIGNKRLTFNEVTNEKELRQYYNLLKESREKIGFKTASYRNYKKLFKNRFYKIFIAKLRETDSIVAGLGTISNENYMLEVNAARDDKVYYANDYLKWSILEYCKKHQIKYYDFAGCNPHPSAGSKDEKLRKFKEKWEGDFYYEYIFKRCWRKGTQHYGQKGYNEETHRKEFMSVIEGIYFKDKKVLDIGAGTGWCGNEFQKRGANVVMIDINPLHEETIKMDMQKLEFENESFDFVNCHGSLHHAIDPSQAVKEMSRALKKNGLLLLTGEAILEGSWLRTRLNRYLLQYPYLIIHDMEEWKAHGRSYLKVEYERWCADAGLEKIKEGVYKKPNSITTATSN